MTDLQTATDSKVNDRSASGRRQAVQRINLRALGGVYLLVTLLVLFSLTDSRFGTADNFRIMAASQAIAGILTLGLMISLISGAFDVSVAANMSFAISFVGWLQVEAGMNAFFSVAATLLAGALIGVVNAFVITVLRVESVIATLGLSALLTAAAFWLVDGQSILYGISPTFTEFGQAKPLSIPAPVFYFVGVSILLWYVLEHTQWGRYLRAGGANPEATRLAGVNVVRLQWVALMLSGTLASLAGVILTMQLGAASFGAGAPYLLPAFAAVFLGSTQIQPGRFNVVGTVVALYLIAVAVKGLQLRNPGVPWIADAITGATLILSVGLSSWFSRRRTRAGSGV